MWALLRPGIEPTSPALPGGFFTTEPPEKPTFNTAFDQNTSLRGCTWNFTPPLIISQTELQMVGCLRVQKAEKLHEVNPQVLRFQIKGTED